MALPRIHTGLPLAVAAVTTLVLALASEASAAPIVRTATGADAAAIQSTVDQFRADLGSARQEVNWDDVPDGGAAPAPLDSNFYKGSKGLVLASSGSMQVSADSSNADAEPVRFGGQNAAYPASFQTFSAERLFGITGNEAASASFVVPGTTNTGVVTGFGAVFTDVDNTSDTRLVFYNEIGAPFRTEYIPPSNNGLSFVGVSFPDGQRVSHVDLIVGTSGLGPSDSPPGSDAVAVDDLIYAQPTTPEPGIVVNDRASNSGPVGLSSPYPSTREIAGLQGTITNVRVNFDWLAASYSNDLDVLVVGPQGQAVTLMSDIGPDSSFYGSLSFDDSGVAMDPSAHLTPGLYHPTDGEETGGCTGNDDYPSPAPAGPYGNALSAFNGTNPNGTWTLYLVDDCNGGLTQLRDWTVDISTTGAPQTTTTTSTAPAKDITKPAGTAAFNKSYRIRSVLKKGLAGTLSSNEAGSAIATATVSAGVAKKLGLGSARTITLASGKATFAAPGKTKLKLSFTHKAKKRLAKVRKLTVTLRITLRDKAGNATVMTRKVALRR
ncbi:MAG: hypothetical protein ACJ76V_03135 [Thermoleophilaceae bacterium]